MKAKEKLKMLSREMAGCRKMAFKDDYYFELFHKWLTEAIAQLEAPLGESKICKQCESWSGECTSSIPCDMDFSAFKVKKAPPSEVLDDGCWMSKCPECRHEFVNCMANNLRIELDRQAGQPLAEPSEFTENLRDVAAYADGSKIPPVRQTWSIPCLLRESADRLEGERDEAYQRGKKDINESLERSRTEVVEAYDEKAAENKELHDRLHEISAGNLRLKEDAKGDLKEIKRLRSVITQICEEREQNP